MKLGIVNAVLFYGGMAIIGLVVLVFGRFAPVCVACRLSLPMLCLCCLC